MTNETDIAVVGAGCRFPDAWTPESFWRNLDAGVVSMREQDEDRLRASGVSEADLKAPDFVRVAATLPGAEDFAAEFFGVSPTEAETIDPQHRLLLESCWEALESAGHPPRADGPVTGIFAGGAPSRYSAALLAAKTMESGLIEAFDDLGLTLGGLGDLMTSRIGYKLGLRGPTVGVQTACSSSLYAVHYATLSLLSGECDIALAGGTTIAEPVTGYRYQPGGLTSEDGYCRSFDATSTGTAFSSGIGVVALRRLSDALADGDPVLAVVRGSAIGNEGSNRPGFTAPTPSGVADVVAAALRVAGVPARLLRYVEAHGSGTALGDHIELLGLTDGLRATTSDSGFCGLGSVKANIGHTGATAGIAGFLKAVHIVRTGNLPPQPMFDRPRDPGILAESPFFVPASASSNLDRDRHVLVNSMGVGGTNAVAVLAPPPAPVRPPAPETEVVRLVLSGRTRAELDALSGRLADELDAGGQAVADVAHTLRVGRRSFTERRVVTAAPGALASVLRLPRPPAARTVRTTAARRAIVVAPEGLDVPRALLAALPGKPEVVREVPTRPSADEFVLLVGTGEAGPARHVLPLEPDTDPGVLADRVEEALTAAWLHGVDVAWETISGGRGRRVTLPTYPFSRRRYWALDRMPPIAAPSSWSRPAATTESTVDNVGTEEPGSIEAELLELWRELFGVSTIGVDDEFGLLGGTSLLYVQMALKVQQRHQVLINVHRSGGSRTTVRRIARIVRGKLGAQGDEAVYQVADGDGELMDADLQLPLADVSETEAPGTDVLLTGATGFLGAFLLHELLASTEGRIYCLVRAADEAEGRERLSNAVKALGLPETDSDRVHVVPGDLHDIAKVCREYRDGELATQVGRVLHCAARVVFTEPYRVLRESNLLPMVDLLSWMRGNGIRDFSFVSTVAATGIAMGTGGKILETREQPLDPEQGGYGVSKWVGERLLERAERDGMRVRVFRPGVIVSSRTTGACNDKDLVWHLLASGLAVGAHPLDERAWPVAPVDVVAKAIAELSFVPGSVGRAYHLVHEKLINPRQMFELLAEAGLPTEAVEPEEWKRRVAEKALATGDEVLSNMTLYELEGEENLGEDDMEAKGWQDWLSRSGLSSEPTGELLRGGLEYLAENKAAAGDLVANLVRTRGTRS
ncbi:polyketide synthase type I [Amycolatopsis sp. WAC 01376]|uniref:thioester reductase domain-containing protein n=1 Tax=Amycolatopsis sp. WAC 01376 TaxID=2203195 RepID=UPI000F76CA96|nr:thioester reductase domain-containing protein [Amycolatopsis sp. WAC 01376]RSM62498.1 polyketide synthase type I [Amycolatopsis sp. WAC 01376]